MSRFLGTFRPVFEKPDCLAFCAFLILFVFCAPAFAQSDMENRLDRIENEVQTLNRAIYKGEPVPAPSITADVKKNAQLEVRLQQLENEIRTIRGALEEQSYRIRQLSEEIKMSAQAVQKNALPAVDSHQGFYTKPVTTPEKAVASKPQVLGQIPEGQASTDQAVNLYENAFALLKNEQYETAAKGFDGFITKYPSHKLTGNAMYWLGETHYVRGDYERAAKAFAQGYQKFPQGSKAADNLLKLGMALSGMNNKDDACVALLQLEQEFKSGAVPVLKRAQQEIKRLGC